MIRLLTALPAFALIAYSASIAARSPVRAQLGADCQPTRIQSDTEGVEFAWIGKQQFGPGAPDAWMPVPTSAIRHVRADRGCACFSADAVRCAVIPFLF